MKRRMGRVSPTRDLISSPWFVVFLFLGVLCSSLIEAGGEHHVIIKSPRRSAEELALEEPFYYDETFLEEVFAGLMMHSDVSLRARHRDLQQLTNAVSPKGTRFCGLKEMPDGSNQCDWPAYIRTVATFAAGGLVMAGLSCVSCPIFCCFRFCCNCFGGRRRSPGWFFGGDASKFEGYSKMHTFGLRVALLAFGALIVIAFSIGFAGNARVQRGIDQLIDATLGNALDLVDKIQKIITKLQNLPPPPAIDFGNNDNNGTNSNSTSSGGTPFAVGNFSDTFGSFTQSGQDIYDKARLVEKVLHDVNRGRTAIVVLGFIIPLLIYLIGGLLGMFFGRNKIMFCAGILFFYASFFVWISLGFHGTMSVLTDQACTEWKIFLSEESAKNQTNAALDVFISCLKGDGPGDFLDSILESVNSAYNQTCNSTSSICNSPGFICTNTNATCGPGTLATYFGSVLVSDTNCTELALNLSLPCIFQNISISECASSCMNEQFRNTSLAINQTLAWVNAIEDILYNEVIPLLNCTFLRDAVRKLEDAFCEDVSKGLDLITTGTALLGICLVFTTIGFIMGYKRFMKDRDGKGSVEMDLQEQKPKKRSLI